MTATTNIENKVQNTNNYFSIANDVYIYEIGLRNIRYDDKDFEFIYKNRRMTAPIPSTEDLNEYPCLVKSVELAMMDEGVPYYEIEKITGYFESYEEEMIENILELRRR